MTLTKILLTRKVQIFFRQAILIAILKKLTEKHADFFYHILPPSAKGRASAASLRPNAERFAAQTLISAMQSSSALWAPLGSLPRTWR